MTIIQTLNRKMSHRPELSRQLAVDLQQLEVPLPESTNAMLELTRSSSLGELVEEPARLIAMSPDELQAFALEVAVRQTAGREAIGVLHRLQTAVAKEFAVHLAAGADAILDNLRTPWDAAVAEARAIVDAGVGAAASEADLLAHDKSTQDRWLAFRRDGSATLSRIATLRTRLSEVAGIVPRPVSFGWEPLDFAAAFTWPVVPGCFDLHRYGRELDHQTWLRLAGNLSLNSTSQLDDIDDLEAQNLSVRSAIENEAMNRANGHTEGAPAHA